MAKSDIAKVELLIRQLLDGQEATRAELRDIHSLLEAVLDQLHRMERRLDQLQSPTYLQ